ncbi:MAG: InlB B-repeat-containing protein, partial [Acutalibacteraceae bacterium]
YRKGYTFDGIYTAASGGTAISNGTALKPSAAATTSVNYYAHWSAIDNPVEFYNSDGQLISKVVSKFDNTIGNVTAPANPTYPGKTEAVNGTYVFEDWIVWDAPLHPDWVGTSISAHTSDKLDAPDTNTPIKFIATYKLSDGAEAKTYTATFVNAAGASIGTVTGAYWTPVTPFDTSTKPALQQGYTGSAVTAENGFDLTNYDYTFEGWTTSPSNGNWGTEADVEYTSADTFRIKANVTLYPCYSKEIKQCSITKKYWSFGSIGAPVITTETVKGTETTLGSVYNLGASDPFSFNFNGFTYTFKGWKKSDTTILYGNDTADIPYSAGKAEITVDSDATFWAIYEKTEIKYNAYYYNGSELIASYEDLSRYSTGTSLITYYTSTQYDLETPVKARNGQTGYTFVGWVEDQTKTLNPEASDLVTNYTFGEQSKAFYAAYESFEYYTVTFKGDDGSVIQTSKDYIANDVIAYTTEEITADDMMYIPIVSNKASGVQFQYTFMGWKSDNDAENTLTFEDETAGTVKYAVAPGEGNNITVTGNRVYTAVFMKEIREYQISLYDIGVNPNLKVNEDGYSCYTNESTEYFVKENVIYTKSDDQYVLYEGTLTVSDLEAVKSDPIKVLTLKYGANILEAVKALYNDGAAVTSDEEVTKIADTELKVVPYGETEKKVIPYETDQYSYAFNGWSPAINPNITVTGDASYVATYRTDNVLYNVHWFTPTSCSASAPYAPQGYTEQTTFYRYKRAIAVPGKTPTVAAPTTIDNYTWTFLGWYECDENKTIKTDSEGNQIKYTKGTLADPGDNHNRDFYYVAKFGFVANEYTVNVYDDTGATLLGTYKGAYGQPVYITNYKKNPDEDYHYTLAGFVDKTDANEAMVPADLDTDTTAYTVTGNVDLKVKYTVEAHDWANAAVSHTVLPTYAAEGTDTYTCVCGFKKTQTVEKLIDTFGPIGKVAIKSYNWDKDGGVAEAYVRADSLVAIMAVDRGQSADVTNEGNGIKSIVYTWSNGVTGSEEYAEFTKTSANVDIQLPDSFTDGMTLTAVITDWIGETYTINTGALYIDSVKPVIDIESTCEGFNLGVKEDHLNSVEATLNGEAFDISPYAVTAEGYAAAYIAQKTETELVPEGDYVVTVTDKAGNTASVVFTVTNAHEWNSGKVTLKATCTEDGEKTFTCTKCGDTRTEAIAATGHEWNAVYEGEGEEKILVEYTYTVDKAATCTEDGEKSIYCVVCNEKMESSTVVIPATGHDEVVTTKEATCTSAGYKIVTCNNCDLYEYTGYEQLEHVVKLDAEGADEDGWIVGKAATCTAKGEKYQICELCGGHINVTETPIIAHDFEDVTPEGDYCTRTVVEGAMPETYHLYKCKVCGYTYAFNIEAKEHTIVKTLKSAATCTEDAVYTYSCEKCDMTPYDQAERLTALEHAWADDFTVDTEATCTEAGSKSIHCTRDGCDAVKDVTAIPATGHDYEAVVTEAATCHTDGKKTYTCKNCGDTYAEIIPADPELHQWDDGVVTTEATCTSEGVMTYTCEICGATKTAVIEMTDHVIGEEIEHTAATCKELEKWVYKCANCDATITVYGTEYAAHVKGALVKTVEAATCTQDGIGIYNCSVCGTTIEDAIPALGHDYKEKVVEATCVTDGYTEVTCSRCDYKETKDIVTATGTHIAVAHAANEATCSADGNSAYYECSVCGKFFSDEDCTTEIEENSWVIPALPHTPTTTAEGEKVYEIVNDSTCAKEGSKVNKCSVCGEVLETVTIAKKAHTKGELITTNKAATCVAQGEGVYKCTVCGGTFTAVIDIDPTAHSFSAWGAWTTDEAATCTATGTEKSVRTCLNGCGLEEEKTRVTAALGHDMVVDYVGAPVTVDGVTTITTYYKCTRCDYTESEDTVTTLFTVTVDDKTIDLINGEKLTEAKIEEALGSIPSKEAEADEDGKYVVVWKLNGEEVKLPADVTANATLTYELKFVANTYTVIFYNYGGKIISQTEYVKGDEVTVPEDQYVSGFRFLGWTDGTNNFAPDEVPAVSGTVSYTPWVISNDSFSTYYVTFKNDTGTKTLYTATLEAQKGETVSFDLPADLAEPTKDSNTVYHYEFAGWVDKDGNSVTFPVDITENVTYKASFTYAKHEDSKTVLKVTPASCVSAEITTYKCEKCGYTWDVYTAPAAGHDYVEYSKVVEGNTTTISYICTVCGDEYTRTVTTGTQTDVIVVKVTDGSLPVSGATVTVYLNATKALTATTDESGNAYFSKENLPDGTYQTKVEKENYDTAAGQMTVKNGTAILKLTITRQLCHCICHSSGLFGKIKRFFNKFIRLFNKNYVCCTCGESERIY